MTQPSYKHAPITEAVIEISFETPISSAEIKKASEKFSSHYPQHQSVQNVKLAVAMPAGQKVKPTAEFVKGGEGHRRSTSDMTQLLVLWRSSFLISQLAPYPGWDDFFQRFVRDWKVWKRAVGFQTISRVGVRYIYRIDIPISESVVKYETFLNIYPKLPDILGSVGTYAVQAGFPIEDIGCKLILNSAVVPSPILDHVSFIIDQDIIKEEDPPQKDEAIYELLNEVRAIKNNVFEACITNPSRELFQR